MQSITVTPIGFVRNAIHGPKDDYWVEVQSRIELDAGKFSVEAIKGLEEFSHVEVLFHFSGVDEGSVLIGSRRPRGNPDWPVTGIFAQRGKARPNRIGATICRV